MAPKRGATPHATAQLVQLADTMAAAHQAIGEAESAATEAAHQAVTAGRLTAAARRRDRLALIEERNKRETDRAVSHPPG